MPSRLATGVVALVFVIALYTGIAYAWSKRSGFDHGAFNSTTTSTGANQSSARVDNGTAYPITPCALRSTAIPLAAQVRARAARGDPATLHIELAPGAEHGVDRAVVMATLMALGTRYEDTRKKGESIPLEYERLLVDWDISRLGGAKSAW